MLDTIRQIWTHSVWADRKLLDALRDCSELHEEALRELSHIIGAEEVWLARLENRSARAPVWPSIRLAELSRLAEETHEGYRALLAGLSESDLKREAEYTNSAGDHFSTPVGDILFHVVLHGQYHRGKVNLLLRQGGVTPVPTDYIAFVRGTPAATHGDAAATGG